jgi:RND family efflux transporter MFP subunit
MFKKNPSVCLCEEGGLPDEAISISRRGLLSEGRHNGKKSVRVIRPFAPFALTLLTILALLLSPAALTVRAQGGSSVIASAVIQPARVAHLGFLSTALVKEINVKEGDVVQAGQILATLDTPELEFAVTAAEAALRSAQAYAELQRYGGSRKFRNGQFVYEAPPHEMIAKADMRVTLAQASLEAAQATFAQSTLIAPFGGTVTSVPVLPGQLVQLDQIVLTIAALDQLQIETTDLAERDIAKIKVGQKAAIFIDALNAEFPATVTAIAPRAETVGGDVVFKVTLAFDEQPAGLLWGMTAEVTITTE